MDRASIEDERKELIILAQKLSSPPEYDGKKRIKLITDPDCL